MLKDLGQNHKGFGLNLKGLWSKSQRISVKILKHFGQNLLLKIFKNFGQNLTGFWPKS